MHRLRITLVALLVLAVLPAVATFAETRVAGTALGADGELISLLQGSYGELFPQGTDASAKEPVLALRTTSPDGSQTLRVVPATIDFDNEESAELVLDPAGGVSYIFWQSWRTEIHSRFRVASFDGEEWRPPIEVSGPTAFWRISPAFAVTQDSFNMLSPEGQEPAELVHRTVLHIMWLEEAEGAQWNTMYAPLVLVDGRYIGAHPVLVLDSVPAEGQTTASDSRFAPVLRPRDAGNSVVAAFLDQGTGKLTALEMKFAAGELSYLGDVVEQEIAEAGTGLDLGSEAGSEALVKAVTARLLKFDHQVKPEILAPLVTTVESHVRQQAQPDASVKAIAGGARVQLVDVGFRLTDGKVGRTGVGARVQLVDVGARSEGPRRTRHHDARSSVAASRGIPAGLSSAPEILVASSGNKLILAWQEADRVLYQESLAGGGWSATQQIRLTDQMDAPKAMGVLKKRVDQ